MCAVEKMAIRKNKPKREKKSLNVSPANNPSASELFVQPPVDTERSDEPASEITEETTDAVNVSSQPTDVQKSKFAITQRVLIAGIVISAALLAYSLVFSPSPLPPPSQTHVSQKQPAVESNATQAQIAQASIIQPQVAQKEPNEPPTVTAAEANQQTPPAEEQLVAQTETTANPQTQESSQKTEPLSLRLADEYFAAKDYVRTYNACSKLRQNLHGKEFELVRDFLYLRMAICMAKKSDSGKATEMFMAVSESQSITLKALANYNLCLLEMNSGQYLKARTKAYKALALTGAIASDYKWALTMEQTCQFLAAEAIARQALSLSDADKELPRKLWYHEEEKDSLAGLDEVELKKF